MLKIYINTNFDKDFKSLFKFFAKMSIVFIKKSDKKFLLNINYGD